MSLLVQSKYLSRISLLIEHPAFNFVWFYCLWFVCVLGANDWLFLAIVVLLFHFIFTSEPRNDFLLSSVIGFIGLCVDCLLSIAGVFEFANNALIPLWLIVLWLGFPLTLRRGLKFLVRFPRLSVLAGSVGGASSYWSGFAFGRVDFAYSTEMTLLILLFVWALLFPALMFLSHRILDATHYSN